MRSIGQPLTRGVAIELSAILLVFLVTCVLLILANP